MDYTEYLPNLIILVAGDEEEVESINKYTFNLILLEHR